MRTAARYLHRSASVAASATRALHNQPPPRRIPRPQDPGAPLGRSNPEFYQNFPRRGTPYWRGAGLFNRSNQDVGVHFFTQMAVVQKMSTSWRFVRALANLPNETYLFTKTLAECGVSREEHDQWLDVVGAHTFDAGIERLERRISSSSAPVPDWVLLHVFANRLATRDDAMQATDYFVNNVLRTPAWDLETKAGCAVITATFLPAITSVRWAGVSSTPFSPRVC